VIVVASFWLPNWVRVNLRRWVENPLIIATVRESVFYPVFRLALALSVVAGGLSCTFAHRSDYGPPRPMMTRARRA